MIVKGFSVEGNFGEKNVEMSEQEYLEAIVQIIKNDEFTTRLK